MRPLWTLLETLGARYGTYNDMVTTHAERLTFSCLCVGASESGNMIDHGLWSRRDYRKQWAKPVIRRSAFKTSKCKAGILSSHPGS
jgi:hypothetical protein